jgi:hypothetical protein
LADRLVAYALKRKASIMSHTSGYQKSWLLEVLGMEFLDHDFAFIYFYTLNLGGHLFCYPLAAIIDAKLPCDTCHLLRCRHIAVYHISLALKPSTATDEISPPVLENGFGRFMNQSEKSETF